MGFLLFLAALFVVAAIVVAIHWLYSWRVGKRRWDQPKAFPLLKRKRHIR